ANSDIQDLPSRYQVYQGRLLASFPDDAKYEHGNKNDHFVPSDINHIGYANFPLQYGGFIPSYAMQHLQLQHLAVQMQQSSYLNSLNAAFNSPNTTFSHPTTTLDPA
nr:hypothetical protein [Tanacetum cinerariifolium]